jgi:hypothetical protein
MEIAETLKLAQETLQGEIAALRDNPGSAEGDSRRLERAVRSLAMLSKEIDRLQNELLTAAENKTDREALALVLADPAMALIARELLDGKHVPPRKAPARRGRQRRVRLSPGEDAGGGSDGDA